MRGMLACQLHPRLLWRATRLIQDRRVITATCGADIYALRKWQILGSTLLIDGLLGGLGPFADG